MLLEFKSKILYNQCRGDRLPASRLLFCNKRKVRAAKGKIVANSNQEQS